MQRDYLILNENSMVDLTERVNKFLALGWVTAGGVLFVTIPSVFGGGCNSIQYIQAIVKEVKE